MLIWWYGLLITRPSLFQTRSCPAYSRTPSVYGSGDVSSGKRWIGKCWSVGTKKNGRDGPVRNGLCCKTQRDSRAPSSCLWLRKSWSWWVCSKWRWLSPETASLRHLICLDYSKHPHLHPCTGGQGARSWKWATSRRWSSSCARFRVDDPRFWRREGWDMCGGRSNVRWVTFQGEDQWIQGEIYEA